MERGSWQSFAWPLARSKKMNSLRRPSSSWMRSRLEWLRNWGKPRHKTLTASPLKRESLEHIYRPIKANSTSFHVFSTIWGWWFMITVQFWNKCNCVKPDLFGDSLVGSWRLPDSRVVESFWFDSHWWVHVTCPLVSREWRAISYPQPLQSEGYGLSFYMVHL